MADRLDSPDAKREVRRVTGAIRIVALGGLGEVGMNCLVIEADGRLLVIDCGLTFPVEEPGVDVIHPDFTWLIARAAQIEGIVITHGHEDHIGALPYLCEHVDAPIHAPAYALGLIERRFEEASLSREPRLHECHAGDALPFGPFQVEPFDVTHSIPGSTGLVIDTPAGVVVHTGDFKLAPNGDPPAGRALARARERGVRLLLSDSTNAEVAGIAGGEAPVARAIDARVAAAHGRVVVCLFGSNVERVASVLRVAHARGRKVLLLGRSLRAHVEIADSLGLLPSPMPPLIHPDAADDIPPGELLVLATGSQGEANAALPRLSTGQHPRLHLESGDEVVLSARVIPGRERAVLPMIDELERRGVRVWTARDDHALHVSGHACQTEQQRMIDALQPRAFLPVHGTYVHLKRHAELARSLGVHESVVADDGAVVEVDAHGTRVVDRIVTGRVHRRAGVALDDATLRQRTAMARQGLVVVSLVRARDGRLVTPVEVLARGLAPDTDALVGEARRQVGRALAAVDPGGSVGELLDAGTRTARRVFEGGLGWRPVIETIVTQIGP
jgi:ribonuclease J